MPAGILTSEVRRVVHDIAAVKTEKLQTDHRADIISLFTITGNLEPPINRIFISYCVKRSWGTWRKPTQQEPQEENPHSTQKGPDPGNIHTNFMVLRSELSRTGVKLLCLI